LRFNVNGKAKVAAAAGFTLEPNPAAHQFHQLRCNRKPKPGAAVAAGAAVIRLDERLEDPLLLIRRNADPCIADAEPQLSLAQGNQISPNSYSAMSGKLDGVSNEVHKDLPQPAGVTRYGRRNLGRDFGGDRQ